MTGITSLVPYGYAVVLGPCAVLALKKILESTCTLLKVYNSKKGEFVVCNGKVIRGSWDGKEGVEAWNAMLKHLEESEEPTHLTLYPPPPETSSLEEEFNVVLGATEETGSEYFSGVSSLALGKHVLAIIHKLEALGIEIDDIEVSVNGNKAIVKIVRPPKSKRADKAVIERVALEYLEFLGVKEVEVEIT